MVISEIISKIEEFAPLDISKDLINKGDYDNSGFLVGDRNVEVDSVVVAVDVSNDAIDLALEKGCNLIITHHPFIYSPISSVTEDDYKGRLIRRLIQNGISVYSSHLPMDMTKNGIDDKFSSYFGGDLTSVMISENTYSYGKVRAIPKTKLYKIVEKLKNDFSSVRFFGEKDKEIACIATFCGKASGKDVRFAIDCDADVFISCDIDHQHLVELNENGISVIELNHGESEFFFFKRIFEELELNVDKYFCETDFRLV